MISNYDVLEVLVEKHVKHMKNCLQPLYEEILDADPDNEDDSEVKKLYRKISIYILLSSGLGNPGVVMNLKEGIAALESVFSMQELYLWVTATRRDKMKQVQELFKIVSGVRLFNRDCNKGGDMITDLPMDLTDSAKACLSMLSNSLIGVMQRVNMLTTAIEGYIFIDQETGNVVLHVLPDEDVTEVHYKQMVELLLFNRQYETYTRRLLTDVDRIVLYSKVLVSSYEVALADLHSAVKFKNAVPCETVFERMSFSVTCSEYCDDDRSDSFAGSITTFTSFVRNTDSLLTLKVDKQLQFLGFCTMCLCQGALVASNLKLGQIKYEGRRYGFCSSRMANRFAKDPQRYINTLLDYARNNPQIIMFLQIRAEIEAVRDVDVLIVKEDLKTVVFDKNIQTETHPLKDNIVREYTWNIWECKRRAINMTTVANFKTHSTQTNQSHYRSDIHCQTAELHDKNAQTKKDAAIMTTKCNYYLWGIRGQRGLGQHMMDQRLPHYKDKLKPIPKSVCVDMKRVDRLEEEEEEED
ncbi:cilia- and flagella-associated protein 206-like [Hyposmocoma kahamanoa]|uniref:cilia- and flagella-associated protein 206-like n=1 Tax=Hyposmocoma kahamanoa TaxID=1477025 RepID=UPI000E6D7DE2|nr:cilia- and flagella-associated protein 206-like [Hyposmocoma kahamanoa]